MNGNGALWSSARRTRSTARARHRLSDAAPDLPHPAEGIEPGRTAGQELIHSDDAGESGLPRPQLVPSEDARESAAPRAGAVSIDKACQPAARNAAGWQSDDTREPSNPKLAGAIVSDDGSGSDALRPELRSSEDDPSDLASRPAASALDPSGEATTEFGVVPEAKPSGLEAPTDVPVPAAGDALAEVELKEATTEAPKRSRKSRGARGALRRVDREELEPPPSQSLIKPLPVKARSPNGHRSAEWSTITLSQTQGRGEFQVVVLERDGRRRVEERSPTFRVPRSLRVRDRGEPRAAHAALVEQRLASGWQRLEVRGRWHDTAFIRYP